jgi:hypothetical protein
MTHDASTVFPLHRYKQTEISGEKLCWAALTPLAESAFGKDCVAAVTPPSDLPQRRRGAEERSEFESSSSQHLCCFASLRQNEILARDFAASTPWDHHS